jgi:hypothetical protein
MIYNAIPAIMFMWAKRQEVRISEEGNMSRCMKGKGTIYSMETL